MDGTPVVGNPCIACKQFNLKDHPRMAEFGMGRCMASTVTLFAHIGRHRPCKTFLAAPPAKVEARRVWWANKIATSDK